MKVDHLLTCVSPRMNPCTLGWYLPLIVKDVPGALQPSERGDRGRQEGEGQGAGGEGSASAAAADGARKERPWNSWQDLDAKFRRDLPDEAYVGRLAYRGLVMRACAQVRMLDGVEVSAKEKEKAERVLVAIMAKSRKSAESS
jgi:protein NUD1